MKYWYDTQDAAKRKTYFFCTGVKTLAIKGGGRGGGGALQKNCRQGFPPPTRWYEPLVPVRMTKALHSRVRWPCVPS